MSRFVFNELQDESAEGVYLVGERAASLRDKSPSTLSAMLESLEEAVEDEGALMLLTMDRFDVCFAFVRDLKHISAAVKEHAVGFLCGLAEKIAAVESTWDGEWSKLGTALKMVTCLLCEVVTRGERVSRAAADASKSAAASKGAGGRGKKKKAAAGSFTDGLGFDWDDARLRATIALGGILNADLGKMFARGTPGEGTISSIMCLRTPVCATVFACCMLLVPYVPHVPLTAIDMLNRTARLLLGVY